MEDIEALARRRPIAFVVLLLLSLVVVEVVAVLLAVTLFRVDRTSPVLGPAVMVVATLYLVFLLWRFRWLRASGVAASGCWEGWLAALVLSNYYLLALLYAFFGERGLNLSAIPVIASTLAGVFIGALFEEILFRGIVLHALARAWGTSRKGLLVAALVSAVVFGVVHALNAIRGDPAEVVGQIAIALFEGVWWAAIVLRWGSIWPVVIVHAVTNWVLRAKALEFTDYHGTPGAYALAVLLGLPLVAIGVWWILGVAVSRPSRASQTGPPIDHAGRDPAQGVS